MVYVEFNTISKHFGTSVAVADLDLQIEQGEFFSLLGPSGCGKSTTLRMLAGFVKPTTGQIRVNGRNVTALPPEARDVGIVFQNYAIFPHMTVFENIAFGLVERKLPRAEIKQKVDAALAEVGMTGFEDRYERELSGDVTPQTQYNWLTSIDQDNKVGLAHTIEQSNFPILYNTPRMCDPGITMS
ncbi:MAG: ABC transporter ATP-binding protein, partial [Paracoccaceae bacterium]